MDIKALNKLAKACRKLGISHLKTSEVELDLSAEVVRPVTRRKRASTHAPVNESLFSDDGLGKTRTLTETELLFWSTAESEQ